MQSKVNKNIKTNIDMKKILLLTAVMLVSMLAMAGSKTKADKDTQNFRYEIECAGNGATGTYMVRVWTYSRKAQVAYNQSAKNAVHGVIFKGFAGTNGCVSQRALAPQPGAEMEYEEYFKHFFEDGGEYQKYVSAIGGTDEVLKVGKEYKVGVTVIVKKDDLRKALEAAGVVKKLGYGF